MFSHAVMTRPPREPITVISIGYYQNVPQKDGNKYFRPQKLTRSHHNAFPGFCFSSP